MFKNFRDFWPFLLGIAIFIAVSAIAQNHLDIFAALLVDSPSRTFAMSLYVLLGMLTVIIPFASLIPLMPIAVLLWGWQTTAFLTIVAWVLGGQILFEVARSYGANAMRRFVPASQLAMVQNIIKDKGLVHAIAVRTVFHGDIVSYAYGMLTDISRWKFFLVTVLGVAPSAIIYSIYGTMPLRWQMILGGLGMLFLGVYWIIGKKLPHRQ